MRRFKNILVHCDAHSGYESLLDRVRWLARSNEASVTLIDVIETDASGLLNVFGAKSQADRAAMASKIEDAHRERIETVASSLRGAGVEVETTVRSGSAMLEIIRRTMEHGHDLVMKAAQPQPNWPLLTSLDMHLIRKCPSAVWIVKSTAPAKATHILAAVDPDPDDSVRDRLNMTVMQLATSLATADEAKLDVLNAWTLFEESALRHGRAKLKPQEVDALVEDRRRVSEWRLNALAREFSAAHSGMRTFSVKGLPGDVIPEHAAADAVDTIVMGTVGRTGISGLLIGNTAETILSRVNCSVLTVKPEGFVSPVAPGA
ncbi:MAG: universal stress protein [Pseudomonadota bacterium]